MLLRDNALVAALAAVAAARSVGASQGLVARGDPVNCDRIQGHVQCAGEKTKKRILIAAEVYQREHIARAGEKRQDGSNQGTTRNTVQLGLGRALQCRAGTHQRTDKQNGEPARDEDIVQDQCDRGQRLQTNVAVAVLVQDGDTVHDHQDQNDDVWGEQHEVEAIQSSVLATSGHRADDIDLFDQEQVDHNLGRCVETDADKDGQRARHEVASVGRVEECCNGGEGP